MEVIVIYGNNVIEALTEFKKRSVREIEKLTAMNVQKIEVIAKGVQIPENNK